MAEKSLQDALQQFIKNSRFKNDIQAYQIKEVWESIMGKTVAKYTEHIQIIGKTLFITTPVAPLKNELSFQKETILKRVNEALGENVVSEVVIK
jgi:predicted nucleic acid-binding Zn ribbon protein